MKEKQDKQGKPCIGVMYTMSLVVGECHWRECVCATECVSEINSLWSGCINAARLVTSQ